MLVVSRRINESIHIGQDIVIAVLEIRGKRVKIGVQAPRDVQVDRTEVYNRKKSEHSADQAAAESSDAQDAEEQMTGGVGA